MIYVLLISFPHQRPRLQVSSLRDGGMGAGVCSTKMLPLTGQDILEVIQAILDNYLPGIMVVSSRPKKPNHVDLADTELGKLQHLT